MIRDHDDVLEEHRNAQYEDHDAKLVATALYEGDWYTLDNHRVYDEFKALVLKGPGWSFIKAFDRQKDGRNAVLTLCCQCEGTSAIQTRKASAYAKISLAKYNGQRRNFTFDQYVEVHQAAYNTLSELDVHLAKMPLTQILLDKIPKVGNVMSGVEKVAARWARLPNMKDDLRSLQVHLKKLRCV